MAGLAVAAAGGIWAVVPSASAAEAPQITAVTGVAEGTTLSGIARIEARTVGQVERVDFDLAGPSTVRWTERAAPYHFMGNVGDAVPGLNPATVQEGAYTLTVRAVGPAGTASRTVRFAVRHVAADPGPRPPVTSPSPSATSAPVAAPVVDAANPSVRDGVATFTASRTIDKFTVPDSWSRIVIGAGVTLKGNFLIPANRTKPLTIAGENAETSQVVGNGPHVKDYSFAGVSTEARIKLTLSTYTSRNPRIFHMHAKKAQLLVSGMRYIDDRDAGNNNSDGFSGGANSVIENTFIDTWDDSVKLYNGDLTIRNTTIVHNRNGAPIQMGWGDYGTGTLTIDGLTVISNSEEIYNQGVVSWAGGVKADSRTIRIVGAGLIRRTNPGMKVAPLYVFQDGVRNKTVKVEGGQCAMVRSTASNTEHRGNSSGNRIVVTGCR
ncbi:hypothetical protein ACPFP2_24810 [Micromonospora citrea]|uniref:hypothetical protein n=1 Tax=Micromonospora citrea TaxID=47855 RepID=UPI003C600649